MTIATENEEAVRTLENVSIFRERRQSKIGLMDGSPARSFTAAA
jgi:hypothetical protein